MADIEMLDPCRMSPAAAAECARLDAMVWPMPGYRPGDPVPPTPDLPPHTGPLTQHPALYVIRAPDRTMAAKALIFPREILTGGGREVIMALAGVCVLPEWRGRGWGAQVVARCFARVDRGDFRWSLFQTDKPEFYRKLGCEVIRNPVVNSLDAGKPAFWDPCAMVYPKQSAPDGPIDLLGPGY